jgi:uncharacterized metal-binding protein YceD (DUF177 family)
MQIDRDPDLELSRRLRLDRVPPSGISLDIKASASEREALARRFGIIAVSELMANVALHAGPAGTWRVDGRLHATVVQACGVTLEPVEQTIDEPFDVRFAAEAEELDHDTGELVVDADAPEPLTGDSLDLGEIVADHLGLAIDPFPRKPGASLADILPVSAAGMERMSPFAVLEQLRRGKKDKN